MTDRLVYVIGPSGSGKDSVLDGLRSCWPEEIPAHWARRTISRPASAHGEQHEPVDEQAFRQLADSESFALHWQANGLRYGVRHAELQPLALGHCVFVNGSRGYLPALLRHRPRATIVHIGASVPVLKERLLARGRETHDAMAARLKREVAVRLPAASIHIQNDGALKDTVSRLLEQILSRYLSPADFAAHLDRLHVQHRHNDD